MGEVKKGQILRPY